jgi:hypothetical protein
MPNDLVRWNDFHRVFSDIFPNTIRDAMDNEEPATVLFSGRHFQIRPRPDGKDFDVYGPAFLGAA